jgi:AcrR family transcriptional regulator
MAVEEHQRPRRPRDRRTQIAAEASELFAARGYHSVRMDEIAEASGITARAIYRHFDNKQALLSHVVLGEQSRLIDVVEELGKSVPDELDLDKSLATLVETALDSPQLSLLWQREARHLTPEDFQLLRDRMKWIASEYKRLLVRPGQPGLDDDGAELRTWAVASILASPSYFDRTLSRSKLAGELSDAAHRAIFSRPTGGAAPAAAEKTPRTPGARRDQLIAAAARAFRRNGYAGVSIDEIGSEVGVVGPALYRYFENKADVLAAAVNRFDEWRALEALRALEQEPRSERVIVGLIGGYVRLGAESPDLLSVGLTERLFLPAKLQDRFDRVQSENVAEWQRWLVAARPELDAQRAAVLVKVTKSVIDDCVRNARLQRSPSLVSELTAVALATLGVLDA